VVLINPSAALLGERNAILSGFGARRYESRFAGPLSIKGVIAGSATWETAEGRYELVPGIVLLLNHGEDYTISVEGLQPVETFNFFFERGFVEDAYRATTSASESLLDAAEPRPMVFGERLHFATPLVEELQRAHRRMRHGEPLEESFYAAALHLVHAHCDAARRAAALPALRASTRAELLRRLETATSFLHANLDGRISIADAARAACLSPFHFHRLFTAFHDVPPHRYLTRLRLDRARALLRTDERPVADVAIACGFESVGSFTTLFTRTFGVSPARFRKNRERG
jgi:AraC-like DNA-binding protein